MRQIGITLPKLDDASYPRLKVPLGDLNYPLILLMAIDHALVDRQQQLLVKKKTMRQLTRKATTVKEQTATTTNNNDDINSVDEGEESDKSDKSNKSEGLATEKESDSN